MKDKKLEKVDLLLLKGYILTMNDRREILSNGGIAIKGEEIVDIGPTKKILDNYYSDNIKDLKGALVHPGLIDAHAHTTMNLARGWVPDYFSHDDVFNYFEKYFFENITPEDEYYSTLLTASEMLQNGTTTFGDTGTSTNGLEGIMEALKKTGIKGKTGFLIADNLIEQLKILKTPVEEALKKLEDQINKYPDSIDKKNSCWVGISGMGYCSDELLLGAKEIANRYNNILIMHQSWSQDEVTGYMKKLKGRRPLEHFLDLGILDSSTTLVHMIFINKDELNIIKKTETKIIHCPGESTRSALGSSVHGFFPEMIEQNIIVGLGSDNSNSSNAFDITKMIYLTSIIHKEARGKLPCISAEDALEMATINGAKIMGMFDSIGSLEIGKKADIVIHNLEHTESHPNFDPLNNLVYSTQSKSVDTVIINGEIIVETGQLKTINIFELYEKIEEKAFNLSKKMGYSVKRTWPVIGKNSNSR